MSRRVAACVVTGFLGSGKTTLLKTLLERDPMRERIAVVVNEIGEIGIDGRVLTGFDYVENVVELASGCVCCSIDEYRFDLAVDELLRRVDPVLLVLETSGAADPGPVVERLRRCGVGVDCVVCVVDARSWQVAWRTGATARRQLAAADFVVVSKGDLVSPRALARRVARVQALNPRARVLVGSADGRFEGAELLLATTAARSASASQAVDRNAASPGVPTRGNRNPDAEAPGLANPGGASPGREATGIPKATVAASTPPPAAGAGDSPAGGHLAREGIESFSWKAAGLVDEAALAAVLRDLPAAVVRAKGIFRRSPDGIATIFHVVCGRVELSPLGGPAPAGETATAVFLGQGVSALRETVLPRLEACRRTGLRAVPG